MKFPEWIWHGGELRPWADATTHVMAHALHYGSSVFEGVRVYETAGGGSAFFRLRDHLRRMVDSARIYRMQLPLDVDGLAAACHAVVHRNGLRTAYVRPFAWRGLGAFGLDPTASPVEVAVAAFSWGAYLGEDALRDGVGVGVSSWQRLAPNTLPPLAKAGGNYLSGQLVTMEAKRHGYAEGLTLGTDGTVSEGAGQNLFVVRDGDVLTPPLSASILAGITRASVLTLLAERGVPVREQRIPRELLYVADEVFLCGTAVEITPVRAVDGAAVGAGRPGPITRQVQADFFGLFDGSREDRHGWLEPVRAADG